MKNKGTNIYTYRPPGVLSEYIAVSEMDPLTIRFEIRSSRENGGQTAYIDLQKWQQFDTLHMCMAALLFPDKASLIAAAPDMLAALQAQEQLASLQFEGEPEAAIAEVRKLRRAAIAKALAA